MLVRRFVGGEGGRLYDSRGYNVNKRRMSRSNNINYKLTQSTTMEASLHHQVALWLRRRLSSGLRCAIFL